MLFSRTFSGNQRLSRCAVEHPAHVTPGCKGEFVTLIQRAVTAIDGTEIDRGELESATYGPSTAAAVLKFKTNRNIINPGYQTKPDNIVGIMTIRALDKEMLPLEMSSKGRDLIRPAGRVD
jgi:hypothetical protein